MSEERLDVLIGQVGEMRGEMRALNSRVAQLEMAVERVAQARGVPPATQHYWIIVYSFIAAAIMIGLFMLAWSNPR